MVVKPDSDNPDRFRKGASVSVGGTARIIEQVHQTDGPLLIRFSGVADRSTAESLRGLDVSIADADRRDLDPDEFWPDQLVGLEVVDASGTGHGVVEAVIDAGLQPRLEVRTEEGIVEIPFVAAIVERVDLGSAVLTVAAIEGLFTPR